MTNKEAIESQPDVDAQLDVNQLDAEHEKVEEQVGAKSDEQPQSDMEEGGAMNVDEADEEVDEETAKAREVARQRLGELGKLVEQLAGRLDRSGARYSFACAKSALAVWMRRSLGRLPANDDALEAGKTRTQAGLVAEAFMKTLLELDNVQSLGDDALRAERRRLVGNINSTLLPRADALFKRCERLAARDAARRSALEPAAMEQETSEPSGTEAAVAPDRASESASAMERDDSESENEAEDEDLGDSSMSEDEEEDEAGPREAARKQQEHVRGAAPRTIKAASLPELRYSTSDEGSYLAIYVAAEHDVDIRACELRVDRSTGTMTLSVAGSKALAFDVSSAQLSPTEATVRLVRPRVLQIKVPKVVQPRRAPRNGWMFGEAPQRLPQRHVAPTRLGWPSARPGMRPFGGSVFEPIWS